MIPIEKKNTNMYIWKIGKFVYLLLRVDSPSSQTDSAKINEDLVEKMTAFSDIWKGRRILDFHEKVFSVASFLNLLISK
jgi:hypothetical protein